MTTKATKNAKGGGTIRKRSDGRWEARYTLGIDPKTGKQIQKSVYGRRRKKSAKSSPPSRRRSMTGRIWSHAA